MLVNSTFINIWVVVVYNDREKRVMKSLYLLPSSVITTTLVAGPIPSGLNTWMEMRYCVYTSNSCISWFCNKREGIRWKIWWWWWIMKSNMNKLKDDDIMKVTFFHCCCCCFRSQFPHRYGFYFTNCHAFLAFPLLF